MTDVRRHIKKLAKDVMITTLITGKVIAVDTTRFTCDVAPSDGGPPFYNVRLKTALSTDEKGLFVVPSVGSTCLIGTLDGNANAAILLQAESIERYLLKLDGGAQLEASPGGMVRINGEDYGGLVKWPALQAQLEKMKAQLVAIDNAFTSFLPASADGTSLKSLMQAFTNLPHADLTNLESQRTKHGGV